MRSLIALFLLASPAAALAQDADGGQPALPAVPAVPVDEPSAPKITLNEAVERALKQNPNVVTAFDELQRGYAQLEQVRSGWMPTLTGNATYTRLDNDRQLNGNTIASANQLSGNLTLAVPLFAPRAWNSYGIAKDLIAATNATAEDAKRLVALAVGRAYLTVLAQRRIVDVDVRAQAAAQAHRDYAQARLNGGVGNRVDLVRAQQQLATDVSLSESARTNLARAREALGVLLGDTHPYDVTDDPAFAAPPSPQQADAGLRDHRLDLQAQETRAKVADDVYGQRWADYVPAVTATFQPFFQDPATLTQPTTGWQAIAALTWPIYDGGLRYGQEKEKKILAHEAHVASDNADRQARSDVRAAFAEVAHADAALVQARDAAKLAREALDLVNVSYRAGASTNIEVIDAERAALDAETQAAVAEDTAREARLDLLSASGRFP